MSSEKTFLGVVRNRKSVRSFSPLSLGSELIQNILTLATYAPTNCNQQLWNFVVVDDPATKECLINEAASNTLIRRAPVVVVITYDGWNTKEAIQGASLAVGHILLAAEYYGIGALPMNSYGADTKIKKILDIPDSEKICCFVLLGYRDERAEKMPHVPRRPVRETLHWGRFGRARTIPFTYDPDDWTLHDLREHQKYYCWKTVSGKEMDIASRWERDIIRLNAEYVRGMAVDVFSYDGSFLKELPDIPIVAIDLNRETSEYTRAAMRSLMGHRTAAISCGVYNEKEKALIDDRVDTVTLLYKLERLPDEVRETVFDQSYQTLRGNGTFFIVARKSNLLLSLFFFVIRGVFGNDIRKTGIFTYFGPYRPIRLRSTLRQLKKTGFREVSWSGYFMIPTFYEQAYQMLVQYIRSEGSSYLHRSSWNDWISACLAFVMKTQGLRKFGWLGSVVVIACKK